MFIIASRGKLRWFIYCRNFFLHTYCVQLTVENIEMHQIQSLSVRIYSLVKEVDWSG